MIQEYDYEKSKPFSRVSAINYIRGHQGMVHQFLNEKSRKEDWLHILKTMMDKNPEMLASMLKLNYTQNENERIQTVVDQIALEGMFTLLLGAKRYGKTAASYWLAEILLEMGYDVYWFGYYPVLKKVYPRIKQVLKIAKIEEGILIYDETLITMFSRDAMTSAIKDRVRVLPTMGHRGGSVLWLSQSLRIDPMIRDLLDYIWFKPLFSMEVFRSGLKGIDYTTKFMMPSKKWENLVISLHTQEPYMFNNPLPKKWDDRLSKPFAMIHDKGLAREYMDQLLDAGFNQRETDTLLKQRGWSFNELFQPFFQKESLTKETAKKGFGQAFGAKREKLEIKTPGGVTVIQCPDCQSFDYESKGSRTTKGGIKRRWICLKCGRNFTTKAF